MKTTRFVSPWIITIVFFAAMVWGTLKFLSYKRGLWEDDIRSKTLEMLVAKKSGLEKSLYSRIYYTKGVAAYVSQKPDISTEEYRLLADEFVKNDSIISTMAISRNCIISAIYPLKGHEAAIGLDLLSHPKRKEIVEKTIKTRKTFVAGPVELVEGGIAFISYTPIFDKTTNVEGDFWGVTDIVIYQDSLFREAGLFTIENNFKFALRGYDGLGDEGEVFWGDSEIFNEDPVLVRIELPDGYWQLAAVPIKGWNAYYNQDQVLKLVLLFSSLIISVLLFIILKFVIKIRNNERELMAIFNSLDALIIEYSADGEYLKIAPTNHNLLVLPINEIIGKKISEVFSEGTALLILNSIKKCIESKKVILVDYQIEFKNELKWFRARVSYKSNQSVIFSAYDITNIKKAEDEIKQSSMRLQKINELKDRLFSILAHDLRNPVGSFKNITELLITEGERFGEEEKNRIIKSIYDTSAGLTDLIENLLSWAQSQGNLLSIKLDKQSVHQMCDLVIDSQSAQALVKKVELKNNVDVNLEALFDNSIAKIVMRNLISNAIKFSYENSVVIINAERDETDLGSRVFIHISDTGCGISSSRIDKVFNWDYLQSTKGTNNEKGSGLGLVLCKEFAEMQGGYIKVKSEEGKGSTFTFVLPLEIVV